MSRTMSIALLFLVIPACNLFSGGSAETGGGESGNRANAGPVFSMMFNESSEYPYRDDWLVIEEVTRRTGVTLDVIPIPDERYGEELDLVLASNSIPDIVLKCWPDQIAPHADRGVLLPFSDYLDLMPNYAQKIVEDDLEEQLARLTRPNGKYYLLPGFQRGIQVQQWIYRKDLFDRYGLGVPATFDDLFNSLALLHQEDPSTTPLTASWGGAHLFSMMGAGFGTAAGWDGVRDYDWKAERWRYAPSTDAWRTMHSFLHHCYERGVLDPAVFTQSNSEFIAKLTDGRGLATVTWISSGFSSWNSILEDAGIPDAEWAPMHPPESPDGVRALPAVDRFRKGLVVPVRVIREPWFEDLLEFLDWAFFSPEGMTLGVWGVEGITYDVTGTGKQFLPHIKTAGNPEATADIRRDYGLNLIFDMCEVPDFEDAKKPPEIAGFLRESLSRGFTAAMDPPFRIEADQVESAAIIMKSLDSYVERMAHAFIVGEEVIDSETVWESYLEELLSRGYPALEEIWNRSEP